MNLLMTSLVKARSSSKVLAAFRDEVATRDWAEGAKAEAIAGMRRRVARENFILMTSV